MSDKIKLGVLGSTRGTDLQGVIEAIESGKLNAEIRIVISNKKDAYILERARKHNLNALFLDPAGKSREEFDEELMKILEKEGIDLILLIGYMKILSDNFIERFWQKTMNIHPSLLPEFAGGMDKNVHQAVLDAGKKETGCTLHFITEVADAGPIILQKRVAVDEGDDVDSLKEKVQKAEQEIIVKGIQLFAEGKLKIEGGKEGKVRILE